MSLPHPHLTQAAEKSAEEKLKDAIVDAQLAHLAALSVSTVCC